MAMFMRIKKFRNKNGVVKLVYKKKYFFFGKWYWFVISRGLGKTYMGYDSVDDMVEAIKQEYKI